VSSASHILHPDHIPPGNDGRNHTHKKLADACAAVKSADPFFCWTPQPAARAPQGSERVRIHRRVWGSWIRAEASRAAAAPNSSARQPRVNPYEAGRMRKGHFHGRVSAREHPPVRAGLWWREGVPYIQHTVQTGSSRIRPRRTPAHRRWKPNVRMVNCQAPGFVQWAAANPARSGRKQR
jgi:hypothetical protein